MWPLRRQQSMRRKWDEGNRDAAISRSAGSAPRCPIVAFGPNQWDRQNWQTRQHLLSSLARRDWPVIYTMGALSLWERHAPAWRAATWGNRSHRQDGVHVFAGGRMHARWPRFEAIEEHAISQHAAALRRLSGPEAGILHLFSPKFAPYIDRFPGWRIAYHIEDAFDMMPGWSPELATLQAHILSRADLVVACAESMVRRLPEPSRVQLLPNGVDFAAYAAGREQPCPEDLAAIPHPRIGYIGALNRKVDFGLIQRLALRHPEWHWALVGATVELPPSPERDAFESCSRLPNVHLLGAKDFSLVPVYAAHMDVNTICYRTDGAGWWHACDPLKLSEYLAAGQPVVSADIENVQPYRDIVPLAKSDDDWAAAIEAVLAADTPEAREVRLAAARQRDWSALVDRLSGWFEDLAAMGGAAARTQPASQAPDRIRDSSSA